MQIELIEAFPLHYPEPHDSGNSRYVTIVKVTASDGGFGLGRVHLPVSRGGPGHPGDRRAGFAPLLKGRGSPRCRAPMADDARPVVVVRQRRHRHLRCQRHRHGIVGPQGQGVAAHPSMIFSAEAPRLARLRQRDLRYRGPGRDPCRVRRLREARLYGGQGRLGQVGRKRLLGSIPSVIWPSCRPSAKRSVPRSIWWSMSAPM